MTLELNDRDCKTSLCQASRFTKVLPMHSRVNKELNKFFFFFLKDKELNKLHHYKVKPYTDSVHLYKVLIKKE
jgi:hypothetical protein